MTKTLRLDVSPDIKKKKKKKKLEIAEVKLKKISKLSTQAETKSIIGQNAEQIHQLLENKDNEAAIPLIYRKMLQSLVDLLPLAERQVRKTKGARGVYQVNILISSIRELLVDVQASQDRGMLGQNLVEQVVKPSFGDLAQTIVTEYAAISADAKLNMNDKEYGRFRTELLASRARLASAMTERFRDIKDQTIQYLER
jgi:elongation factor P--beta-lysine ligase